MEAVPLNYKRPKDQVIPTLLVGTQPIQPYLAKWPAGPRPASSHSFTTTSPSKGVTSRHAAAYASLSRRQPGGQEIPKTVMTPKDLDARIDQADKTFRPLIRLAATIRTRLVSANEGLPSGKPSH